MPEKSPSPDEKKSLIPKPAEKRDVALEKLAQATTDQQVVLWTQVRGELARQDNEAEQTTHKHWKEKEEIRERRIIGRSALVIGVGLVIGGISAPVLVVPGMFLLGVGCYRAAPSFVSSYFKKKRGNDE